MVDSKGATSPPVPTFQNNHHCLLHSGADLKILFACFIKKEKLVIIIMGYSSGAGELTLAEDLGSVTSTHIR